MFHILPLQLSTYRFFVGDVENLRPKSSSEPGVGEDNRKIWLIALAGQLRRMFHTIISGFMRDHLPQSMHRQRAGLPHLPGQQLMLLEYHPRTTTEA